MTLLSVWARSSTTVGAIISDAAELPAALDCWVTVTRGAIRYLRVAFRRGVVGETPRGQVGLLPR